MEEKRLVAKTLSDSEESLYNNSSGAIVKTILLHNSNSEEKEVTLKLDSVTFLFTLKKQKTLQIKAQRIHLQHSRFHLERLYILLHYYFNFTTTWRYGSLPSLYVST